jgi:hypothetical protein
VKSVTYKPTPATASNATTATRIGIFITSLT